MNGNPTLNWEVFSNHGAPAWLSRCVSAEGVQCNGRELCLSRSMGAQRQVVWTEQSRRLLLKDCKSIPELPFKSTTAAVSGRSSQIGTIVPSCYCWWSGLQPRFTCWCVASGRTASHGEAIQVYPFGIWRKRRRSGGSSQQFGWRMWLPPHPGYYTRQKQTAGFDS